jgi:hypothetical protein
MVWFFAGAYLCGALFTFCAVGFCVMLGGDSRQLWKPFAYAVLWPVALPWALWPFFIRWLARRLREDS